MRFPKYQWMQEEPAQECGFCDNLIIPQYTFEGSDYPKFQVLFDQTKTLDLLTTNPFSQISSPNYQFDYNGAVPLTNQVHLYYFGGVQFVIKYFDNPLKDSSEIYYRYINGVHYIDWYKTSGFSSDWCDKYEEVFDLYVVPNVPGLSLSTYGSAPRTFLFSNVPANSYFYDSGSLLSNIITLTPSTILDTTIDGFLYNNGNLCLFETSNTKHFQFKVSVTAQKYYYLSLPYTSNGSSFTITYTITPVTSGSLIYNTDPVTITNSGGELVLNMFSFDTADFIIDIEVTDNDNSGSGLCFNSVDFYDIGFGIESVKYQNCEGDYVSVEVTTWDDFPDEVYYKNSRLLGILDPINDTVFRIVIEDADGNKLTSRYYSIRTPESCDLGKLYSVEWTDNCLFGEIQYNALPFTNKLLLTGALIKGSLENIDSVESTTSTGKKISIYRNSQCVYEFRVHPFLADTMETIIERIFEHTFTIDGKSYNTTDVFKVSEIDLGIYTGRVDLYKSDSAVITSLCCC